MVKLLGGSSSLETIVNDMNANLLEQQGKETTQIFKDDSGTRRVLLGKQKSTGFYGLKVSQEGVDVYEADDDELVFNSSQNVFKIVERGTSVIPKFSISGAGGGSSLLTIPHGQANVPIVQAYVEATSLNWSTASSIASSYIPLPLLQTDDVVTGYFFEAANGSFYKPQVTLAVDDTNIYIQAVYTNSTATTINDIPVTYFIMQETAE